jgi:biotin transport system substrate-specific component
MSQSLAVVAWNSLLGERQARYGTVVREAVLIAAGSLLVAGAAQVVIPLPFTPVPITGQTFAVLLVGASLGAGRGAASLALYLGEGAAGLPFFAGGASGIAVITGVTGGYLVGFVFAGTLVGFLAQRGWDRRFASALGAMLTGNLVIYLFGVLGLAAFMGASPLSEEVLLAGLYPFVPGDLIRIYLAAAALPGAWRLVRRNDRPASPLSLKDFSSD